jgi:hypothetical protein
MLVARRDPPLHVDARDGASPNFAGYPAPKASKLARFVTITQMLGSLLAVPVGIASAYSFYRANFSPETTCQSLRSGIVAMLDKSVDPAARRVLVRRDVEVFEKTCATVDPDATAAFKALLAADKTAAPAAAPIVPRVQRNEAPPKETIRKAEPRPQAPAKQSATAAAPTTAEPARRDPAISDAQWLEAVRQALVTHKQEPPVRAPAPVPDVVKTQPQARPAPRDAISPSPPVAPESQVNTSVVPSAAPALPPAIAIAPPPAAAQATDNHPVPPESIPDSSPPADAAKPNEQNRSRFGKWISAIPLLGNVVDNARH